MTDIRTIVVPVCATGFERPHGDGDRGEVRTELAVHGQHQHGQNTEDLWASISQPGIF